MRRKDLEKQGTGCKEKLGARDEGQQTVWTLRRVDTEGRRGTVGHGFLN